MNEILDYEEPCFVISVAARIIGVQTQTLRYYEKLGLIEPYRTGGNQRIFSRRDIEKIQYVRSLMEDLGVNLAGVEVVMGLVNRLQETKETLKQIQAENKQLRDMLKQ